MEHYEDILEGYLKIKASPKDFYNAEERLAKAKAAIKQFDLDLDEALRQLNEADLRDFDISLRILDKEKHTDTGFFKLDKPKEKLWAKNLILILIKLPIMLSAKATKQQKSSKPTRLKKNGQPIFLEKLTPEQQSAITAKAPQLVDNFVSDQNALLDFGQSAVEEVNGTVNRILAEQKKLQIPQVDELLKIPTKNSMALSQNTRMPK